MGGGVAAALRKAGGKEIEEEAVESAPLELGQAIATTAGKLDAKFVIHAASMKLGQPATEENVRTAFKNALELADSLECQQVAVPAIGTGAGGLSVDVCARLLLEETRSFSGSFLKTVVFVVHAPDAVPVFTQKARELGIELTDFKAFERSLEEANEQRERLREQNESEHASEEPVMERETENSDESGS